METAREPGELWVENSSEGGSAVRTVKRLGREKKRACVLGNRHGRSVPWVWGRYGFL